MLENRDIEKNSSYMECYFPSPDTVISYENGGGVRSRFCDDSWILKSNELRIKRGVIYFPDTLNYDTINCVKYIMYLLMFKKDGRRLSDGTLINYSSVVFLFAKFVEDRNYDFFKIFSDAGLMGEFFDNISGWNKETAGSIFNALSKMNDFEIGFKVVSSRKMLGIKGLDYEYRANLKQHAPLPTRIYSTILNSLSDKLDEWDLLKNEVLFLVSNCYKNKLWGRTKDYRSYVKNDVFLKDNYPKFDEICSIRLKNYMINGGYLFSIRGLWSLIGEVQLAAKLTIQAYTGMRDDEATTLPLYCEFIRNLKGKNFWLINGFSTKFNHGVLKSAHWVTNSESVRAVKIARDIAICISDAIGIKYDENKNNIPLFTSVGYFWKLEASNNRLQPGIINLSTMKKFKNKIEPVIERDDLNELQQIDLHRAWSVELKFKVGRPWGFSSHQLRRSLAIYAHRSGIVSLPSLRRQLQQITEAMASYYTKGSYFALDFTSRLNKNHFIYEWQNSVPASSAMGYIKNVLNSDEKLSGGHGSWVESRIKSDIVLFETNRENVVKMFKRGEISYRETLIGGCTSVGGCHQPVINWLNLDCLKSNCKNMVCTPSNLNRLILCQESLIAKLEVDSIEYRVEMAALKVMSDAYKIFK